MFNNDLCAFGIMQKINDEWQDSVFMKSSATAIISVRVLTPWHPMLVDCDAINFYGSFIFALNLYLTNKTCRKQFQFFYDKFYFDLWHAKTSMHPYLFRLQHMIDNCSLFSPHEGSINSANRWIVSIGSKWKKHNTLKIIPWFSMSQHSS